MKITVEIKNVYGKELIYPICETSEKLCKLTGKKTFSRSDIATIKSLGYSIELHQSEVI